MRNVHSYDNDSCIGLMDAQADMFMFLSDELAEVDTDAFIKEWLSSNTRAALDDGSPKFLYKSGVELLSWFINQETKGQYPKGISEYKPHVLHWVGLMYQLYAYEEKIASAELVKILPPDVLYSMYYPWHELSDLGAVKRIKKYLEETS